MNPQSDTWRFLGSMPAVQRYKIHPQRDIIHEVTGLNGVGSWRSQYSIAHSSRTTAPILNLIAGGCWARRQLRSGIKGVSVASKLRRSLTLVSVVFIDTLALPELDVRFRHSHCSNPESDCGRSLDSTPATQQYKGRLCRIRSQEIADPCESCLDRYPGDLSLDAGLLHNRGTDLESVCEELLGSTPASQRYKARPCHIKAYEIAVFCAGCIRYQAAIFYSMADYSTAAGRILLPFAGGCWTRRQLRGGIRCVSVASILRKSLTLVGVVFIGTLAIPDLDG